MEEEVIYCNGISYLKFSPDYCVKEAVFQRQQCGRDSFSLSAGCLSAWGEAEADNGWELRQSGRKAERICLRFKSKVVIDERTRSLARLSPAHTHRSDNLSIPPYSLLSALMLFDASAPSLPQPHVCLKLSFTNLL